ncbi:MAG: bifunctional methylenetetrahydrofolate dehydrogenase/methenyltetrahydrofolate cyclohydrolase FolD [Myxococcota bacterium]|nr:bifunctional methylenetetrahydrofolate dehydrogenase/methenyltetrahydrofolate cyclohydrolase FolD [Myxococcota bacterium]
MALLDGKKLAKSIRKDVREGAQDFAKRWGRPPTLDVVIVGEDPASQIYVRNKERACLKAGLISHTHRLSADLSQSDLIELVRNLNIDEAVDGVIVQLPLPEHIDPDVVIRAIGPIKDVDGFHPINLGHLFAGRPGLIPCTPLACMRLLDMAEVDLKGKNAVVVGRSMTVGKPMAMMLLERHATVTVCHSRTEKLAHVVAEADVVIAAVGQAELIKGEWIKRGAVVIDVGINRLEDGALVGDVEFDTASARASWITPVPGGVGPMTVACLISNTLEAAKKRVA